MVICTSVLKHSSIFGGEDGEQSTTFHTIRSRSNSIIEKWEDLMTDYRIIDADGHVMELDSELRDFIGPPYKDLEWHQSYSFWPGLTMDGYLRSLRQNGGWAGGGDGPKANHWLEFLDKNKIE